LRHRPRLRRHQVTEAVRAIVAPNAILIGINFIIIIIIIGINFQHIFWPVWIMLQRRQRFNQSGAAFMKKQGGTDAALDIT
jgi:hypothetical protein